MATEFVMPKLGLTMEEGRITEWLAGDGEVVSAGKAVLVIETDKVETEVESPGDGVLHRTGAVGDTFACGEVIGFLLADGEAVPAAPVASAPTPAPSAGTAASPQPSSAPTATDAGGRVVASPNARRVASEHSISLAEVRGTGPGGRIVSEDVADFAARPRPVPPRPAVPGSWAAPSPASATPATAAARQLADLLGVDLRLVASGAGDGRRTKEDVAAFVRQQLAALDQRDRSDPTSSSSPLLQQPTDVIPFTGMRGAIAERMHASLTEMAQLTLHLDADMGAVVADRAARKKSGAAPGYTDYVIAAVARALRGHPIVNSQVTDEGVALLPDIHVGMAVAVDDGLLVPVVKHADRLGLTALSAETTRLADAARAKKLSLTDVEGGTFSVTALGMYGVDGFTPVINAPNAAILGVGRLRDETRIVDWGTATSTVLTLSLTWDHRVLDGAPAAAFTARIAELLGDPTALDEV